MPEPIDAPEADNAKALAKLISDMQVRFEQELNDLKIKHAQEIPEITGGRGSTGKENF